MSEDSFDLIEDDDEEIATTDNDYDGDEIPPEIAMRILGKKDREEQSEKKDLVISSINVAGVKGSKDLKKTIVARRDKSGMWIIAFKEGGKTPGLLEGKFTDISAVEDAVNSYLAKTNSEKQAVAA